jgi:hypothetical protein
MMLRIRRWWRNTKEAALPVRRLVIVEGEGLPVEMPSRDLILLRDHVEDWSVGFRCPCGCGEVVELMLLKIAKPRWTLAIDQKGRPSLRPSILRTKGCRSHFWIRAGRAEWSD